MNCLITLYDHAATGFVDLLEEIVENQIDMENVGLVQVHSVFPPASKQCPDRDYDAMEQLLASQFSISHVCAQVRDGMIEQDAKKDSIHVRCSTTRLEHYIKSKANGAIFLNLRKSLDVMDSDDWQRFISALYANENLKLLRGGKVPDQLNEFLGPDRVLEVLPALCILCQGFLGAWRETEPDAERLAVGEIEEALKLMRWDELPQEIRNSVRERLGGDCPNDQQELFFSDLYKPSWWQVFEVNRYDSLKSLIEREFSGYETNGEISRDSVLKLAKFISSKTDISNNNMPEMVASAYISIYRVLEQS